MVVCFPVCGRFCPLLDHVGGASGVPGHGLRVHQPAGNSKIVASVVPEVTPEASQGPLKGAMSAQKALQRVPDGDEGGGGKKRERSVYPNDGLLF